MLPLKNPQNRIVENPQADLEVGLENCDKLVVADQDEGATNGPQNVGEVTL